MTGLSNLYLDQVWIREENVQQYRLSYHKFVRLGWTNAYPVDINVDTVHTGQPIICLIYYNQMGGTSSCVLSAAMRHQMKPTAMAKEELIKEILRGMSGTLAL